jgi:hypothetical protein
MFDKIGLADMTQGDLTSFIEDRFGNANSALALNGGFTVVPSGIYFDTPEFTISLWIYPQQVDNGARVIDFGNQLLSNNIVITLSHQTPSLYNLVTPKLTIYSQQNVTIEALSAQNMQTNQWHFVAFTFDGMNARIYIDGQLSADVMHAYSLENLNRSNCFIGKNNWLDGHSYSSYSHLDDLRFFNKSLTHQEILELMHRNETSKWRKIF